MKQFLMKDGELKVEVWSDHVVRIRYSREKADQLQIQRENLALVGQPSPTKWTLKEDARTASIVTDVIKVRIDLETGAIAFLDTENSVVLQETGVDQRMNATTVEGEKTYTCSQSFVTDPKERYFGLGEWSSLKEAGQVVLKQENRRTCIPVLCSSRGYGLFWNNPALTKVHFKNNSVSWESEVGESVDYFFIYGPQLDSVIASFRSLTGQAPLLPKWAYGLWFSRNKYQRQAEILKAAATFRARGIPLDLIIQDYFYWPDKWGTHEFDRKRYPDPAEMIKTLHDVHHLKFMAVVWAKLDPTIEHGKQMAAVNGLLPPGKWDDKGWDWAGNLQYYDPFNAKARELFWKQVHGKLFSLDLDAWWLDASEPEIRGSWRGADTALGKGARVFNAFPLMHTRTFYEGQRAATNRKRVVVLTRSGWAGQQRNSAVCWSGDIHGDWETLKSQIESSQNFCMAGIPYWTSDIGGYVAHYSLPGYRELFIRWYQWGAFCPIFRIHGAGQPHPWEMGKDVERNVINYARLRYRLLPYIYSLAHRISQDGYTLMRPLAMDFPADPMALESMQEFMFGPALLVAPVTKSIAVDDTENTPSSQPSDADPRLPVQDVYLPETTDWFDLWTGKRHKGGKTVMAPIPLDTIPLFVRAGSIIPMGPDLQYCDEEPADPIDLRIYPGANGSFALYEDEGDSYNYEKGAYATIPISWEDETKTLTIGKRKGSFPGMLNERTFRVTVVKPGNAVGIAPTAKPDKIIRYKGKPIVVRMSKD